MTRNNPERNTSTPAMKPLQNKLLLEIKKNRLKKQINKMNNLLNKIRFIMHLIKSILDLRVKYQRFIREGIHQWKKNSLNRNFRNKINLEI